MALRVCLAAVCLLLVSAEMLLSAEPPTERAAQEAPETPESELTANSGLTVQILQENLTLDPERPFVWCSTIEDPIPIYVDSEDWEYATVGEFKHQGNDSDWAGLKNKVKLLPGPKAMTGRKLGLKKKTPSILTLTFLLENSELKKVKKWCEGSAPPEFHLIKFTISVENEPGNGRHVDPGIGVKR